VADTGLDRPPAATNPSEVALFPVPHTGNFGYVASTVVSGVHGAIHSLFSSPRETLGDTRGSASSSSLH